MIMIERRPGQDITLDTKAEAYEGVDRIHRQQQVLSLLEELGPLTAKEVAVEMYRRGLTPNDERNNAAPRLTELCKIGLVEPIGKRPCRYTGKSVAVYARRSAENKYIRDEWVEDGEVF